MFCKRSWRRKLGRHWCFPIMFCFLSYKGKFRCYRYDVVDVSCSEAPVKSSSPRGPVRQCSRPQNEIYDFAYIFIANIRLFFGQTVGSTDVRSTHTKYWENPIFLSQHRVFFFASTFWRNSYVLNLSDISDIFISPPHIFLSDTSICSYPRIVLIRGPTLIMRYNTFTYDTTIYTYTNAIDDIVYKNYKARQC